MSSEFAKIGCAFSMNKVSSFHAVVFGIGDSAPPPDFIGVEIGRPSAALHVGYSCSFFIEDIENIVCPISSVCANTGKNLSIATQPLSMDSSVRATSNSHFCRIPMRIHICLMRKTLRICNSAVRITVRIHTSQVQKQWLSAFVFSDVLCFPQCDVGEFQQVIVLLFYYHISSARCVNTLLLDYISGKRCHLFSFSKWY